MLASIAVAAPSFADVPAPDEGPQVVPQVWSPARIAKVKEQIAIQEGRAAALQPIVDRDVTAQVALRANAAALDKLATDETEQAVEYRDIAAAAPDTRTQAAFIVFAKKLETFAKQMRSPPAKTVPSRAFPDLTSQLESRIRVPLSNPHFLRA